MRGFLAWAVAGALVTFGVLGAASIGLPFLLAGVLLCARLAADENAPEVYGAAFGAAAVLTVIGLIWLGPGGFDARVFFALAAVALAAGVAGCFASHSDARER